MKRSAARVSRRVRYLTQDVRFVVRRTAKRVGKVLTPARLVVAVALFAVVALVVAQFLDYRSLAVGAGDYAAYPGIESVATAPTVDQDQASFSSAHGALMIFLSLAALLAIGLALSGRSRLGWAIAGLGMIALAIALAIDLPAGLDEGDATARYEGADANLEKGFWLEVVGAGVLAFSGALLVLHGRGADRKKA